MLLAQGYRCISYDRRGFGHSSQPTTGYDYDTFAADLKSLLDHLALEQDVVLAGFSMGTGEVTRYLGTYGSAGISKAVLIGSIPPYLLQADDNPQGVPKDVFDGFKQAIVADRYAFLDSFLGNLYNTDVSITERLSEAALRASSQVAAGSGPYATYACIDTWLTDFRGDLPKIDIPVLAIHGTADRVLPFEVTTARLRDEQLIDDLTVVEIAGWPPQRRLDSRRRGQFGIAVVLRERSGGQTRSDGDDWPDVSLRTRAAAGAPADGRACPLFTSRIC